MHYVYYYIGRLSAVHGQYSEFRKVLSMKAGYTLVNAAGVDLTKTGETTQTIAGIFAKLQKAMSTGKLIILEGVVMGSGKGMSPIVVSPYMSSGAVTFKYNMDTVSIANTNVITITPYTPPVEG